MISHKQRMIGLLSERLQSLVDDRTGIGSAVRVRRVTSLITSGPRGWAEKLTESGQPFIRSANLRQDAIRLRSDNLACVTPDETPEAERSRARPGDTLIGITGANTGWVGLVDTSLSGGYVSQHVALLRPARIEPRWLAFSLFSRKTQDQLAAGQYGGTKQQLGLEDLAELQIFVPSLTEQVEVSNELDNSFLKREKSCALLERQIALLRERRQALITAAVTGEIDVTKGPA